MENVLENILDENNPLEPPVEGEASNPPVEGEASNPPVEGEASNPPVVENKPMVSVEDIDKIVEKKIQEKEVKKDIGSKMKSFQESVTQYDQENQGALSELIKNNPNLKFSKDTALGIINLSGKDGSGKDIRSSVYHYLYKNPSIAIELNALDTNQQLIKLGGIAESLKAKSSNNTQAPPPISTIDQGGGPAINKSLYDKDISTKDYMKIRLKQLNGA